MTLDQFLTAQGLTLDLVAAEAARHLALVPGDCLFLAGSLVEGIGTPTSDIDLFLVTDRENFQFHSMTDIALVVGDTLIDIRVVKHQDVRALATRFLVWRNAPRLPRRSFEFIEDERKLMYRIAVGRSLFGHDVMLALKADFTLADLARHKLDWARHLASATQIDIAGFLKANDRHSVFFATQELLGLTVDGLLAGFEYANPNTKWRARLLSCLEDDWENHLPGRRTGLSAQDRYLKLYTGMRADELQSIYLHALEVSAFSRAVFPWAEMRLLGARPAPHTSAVRPVPGPSPAHPLPPLGVDVEIRYSGGHLEVLRLNNSTEPLVFPAETHAFLACFDGVTDWSEALDSRRPEAGSGASKPAPGLDEIASALRFAGLESQAPLDEALLQKILCPA
jgi:hypothetical protein